MDANDPLVIRITSGRLAAPVAPTGAVSEIRRLPVPAGPSSGVGGLLDQAPGVFAASRYNAAQDLRLSIRGFGARGNFGIRGIRIYLDGLPLTLPDGQSSVDEIDPGALRAAEVRRGLSSALYGSAAGGVVKLTSDDLFAEPGWRIGGGAGSFGAFDARARLGYVAPGQDLALGAAFASRGAEGYRDHASALHHRLALRYALRPSATEQWLLTLNALDSPYAEDPGGLTARELDRDRRAAAPLNRRFDAGEEVRQQRLGARWRRSLGGVDELRIGGYWLDRDFANKLPFSATELDRAVGGFSLELERAGIGMLGPWRWLVGADLDVQDDERERFANDDGVVGVRTAAQRERVAAVGVFSQWHVSPLDRLDLELGLRGDLIDIDFRDRFLGDGDDSGQRTFREFSPSAGLTWQFTEAAHLFGRIGTAFETPTTTELADPSGRGGFNDALEPQRAVGVEAGLRWEARRIGSGELALYYTRVEDQLVPRPIPGQPGRFFYVNAASSRYAGLELDLSRSLTPELNARLGASLARLRFDRFTDSDGNRFDGNRIPGVPERELSLTLDWLPAGPWSGALRYRWVGTRFAEDANAVRVDDYAVLDLALGYEAWLGGGRLRLGAGVDNLLDVRYEDNLRINAAGGRYFEPAPDRSFYLNLALEHSL